MGYTFQPEGGGEGMPWKERSVMDERMRFVIRLKDGETMAALCREFCSIPRPVFRHHRSF